MLRQQANRCTEAAVYGSVCPSSVCTDALRQQRYGSEQEANTRQLVGAAADAILAAIPAFRFCCIRILSADALETATGCVAAFSQSVGPLVALAIEGACGQLYTSGWFLHCDGRVTLVPGAEKGKAVLLGQG